MFGLTWMGTLFCFYVEEDQHRFALNPKLLMHVGQWYEFVLVGSGHEDEEKTVVYADPIYMTRQDVLER